MLAQLESAERHYLSLVAMAKAGTLGEDPTRVLAEMGAFASSAVAAVEHATGKDSPYSTHARRYAEQIDTPSVPVAPFGIPAIHLLKGVLDSARTDCIAGHLISYEEHIRGNLFTDLLELAERLIDENSSRILPTIVAGTALEVHLRDLCKRHNIPLVIAKGNSLTPKSADRMNGDLKRAQVYQVSDYKQVALWQRMRVDAVRGGHGNYDSTYVKGMVQGVRDFIAKYPA